MPAYHEQHRPKTWEDIAGQDSARNRLRGLLARSWGGRAVWIQGPSGTGKTTMARIAANAADPLYATELTARELTVGALDRLIDRMRYRPLSGAGHVVIVNEVHGLSRPVRERLLGHLDPVPDSELWIFTTTNEAQANLFEDDNGDNDALFSRCTLIRTTANDEAIGKMADRARSLAIADGIDGMPPEVYKAALRSRKGNMRALLGDVESGRLAEFATEYAAAKREFEILRSTKGDRAEARRAELKAIIG